MLIERERAVRFYKENKQSVFVLKYDWIMNNTDGAVSAYIYISYNYFKLKDQIYNKNHV